MTLHIIEAIAAGLKESLAMLTATFWALVLGFVLSGLVQSFGQQAEIRRSLGDGSLAAILRATGLGAISSSCSYAASAMAKSMFAKGADFVAAMVFMFASTNLVIELGVVLAVLIGWQFTASEFLGGLLMIGLLVVVARVTLPRSAVEAARRRLQLPTTDSAAQPPGSEPSSGHSLAWRLRQREGWGDAATYAIADLTMLRKEIAGGFLAAGFLAALVPAAVWRVLFVPGHGFGSSLENVLVGPLIALLSFVCSVGNVPLAAALWKGGISFGGVLSFLFADLITFPLLLIYKKFYGLRITLRLLGTFWLVMSAAGLATQYLFQAFGAVPTTRPVQIASGALGWDLNSALDLVALAVLVVVVILAAQRRQQLSSSSSWAIDPVCGMRVEVDSAPARTTTDGQTTYFCSDRCRDRFLKARTTVGPAHDGAPDALSLSDHQQSATSIDPICGMTVNREQAAASLVYPGGTLYFCSAGCARRYQNQNGSPWQPLATTGGDSVDP